MKNNCQKKKENKIEIRYVIVTCCLFIWDVIHLRWGKQLGFFAEKTNEKQFYPTNDYYSNVFITRSKQ